MLPLQLRRFTILEPSCSAFAPALKPLTRLSMK